jgi:hypothetical protein
VQPVERGSGPDASGAFFPPGRFTGNVEMGNTDGNAFFRARLGVTDAAMKTAFWQHAGLPVASARSNLSLVIDTTGTSPQAMLDTATGSGSLELSDLRISGLNSKALGPILKGVDAVPTDVNDAMVAPIVQSALFDGTLDFNKLDVPFAITGAKLRADKVQGQNDDMQLNAEGTLALADATLDATVETTFNPGEQAVAGADPTVRLIWQGPFITPTRTVDLTQMTSFLSLRRFEQERRRVEILQARMAEQQRLRRESMLYRTRAAERERLKEKALDDARLLQQQQEALKALARQEEEKRRQQNGGVDPEDVPAQ